MDKICTTSYKLYKPNLKNNTSISIISDLHYNETTTDKLLNQILTHINSLNPNYIIIPGDLLDSIDKVQNKQQMQKLLNWLKSLSTISYVIISLGNHDLYKEKNTYKFGELPWKASTEKEFFNKVNDITNIDVLNNSSYIDDNIYVTGVTNSFDYYNCKGENKNLLLKELQDVCNQKSINISKDKLSFALIHSPVYLNDPDIKEMLKDYNYIISGHMHYGCIPPIFDKIWKSDKGIISPTYNLFPNNCRNTIKDKDDKLIVNGALNTLGSSKGILRVVNNLFPIHNTLLEFNNNPEINIQKIYTK